MNITCPQCGFSRDVSERSLPREHVVAKCPKCGCRFRFSAHAGAGAILPPKSWNNGESDEDIRVTASNAYAAEAKRFENEQKTEEANWHRQKSAKRNPWAEAPAPDGWLMAFYQTVLRVMFRPKEFGQTISAGSSIRRALLFFLIIALFQTLTERFWLQLLYSALENANSADNHLQQLLALFNNSGNLFEYAIFRSAALILQLYAFSLLMFLGYRLVIKDQASFRQIFQLLAYSAGPWILCIIPFIGSLMGAFWSLCSLALSCKAAMRLNWSQVCIGFLPIILLISPLLIQLWLAVPS